MLVFNRARYTDTAGPTLSFHCGQCDRDVVGACVERAEKFLAAGFVPLFTRTNTYVFCGQCGTRYLSRLRVIALEHITDQDVTPFLKREVNIVGMTLVIAALLLCLWPLLGLLLTAIAVAVTWRRPGWRRLLSRIALGIAVAEHLAIGIAFLLHAG